jgi:hypothetical protein
MQYDMRTVDRGACFNGGGVFIHKLISITGECISAVGTHRVFHLGQIFWWIERMREIGYARRRGWPGPRGSIWEAPKRPNAPDRPRPSSSDSRTVVKTHGGRRSPDLNIPPPLRRIMK